MPNIIMLNQEIVQTDLLEQIASIVKQIDYKLISLAEAKANQDDWLTNTSAVIVFGNMGQIYNDNAPLIEVIDFNITTTKKIRILPVSLYLDYDPREGDSRKLFPSIIAGLFAMTLSSKRLTKFHAALVESLSK